VQADGKLVATNVSILGGDVTLDPNGITIASYSSQSDPNIIKWKHSSTEDARVFATDSGAFQIQPRTSFIVMLDSGKHIGFGTNFYVDTALQADGDITSDANLNAVNALLTGNLQSYKNSTAYDVYGLRVLTAPLTDTAWDGDAYSDTADCFRRTGWHQGSLDLDHRSRQRCLGNF
jgi:hypothetical protein